jgi:hypothetical protein
VETLTERSQAAGGWLRQDDFRHVERMTFTDAVGASTAYVHPGTDQLFVLGVPGAAIEDRR